MTIGTKIIDSARKLKESNKKEGDQSDDEDHMYPMDGKSLFYFSNVNSLRKALYTIQKSILFEYFILLVVIGSSILMAWDNPRS
jgi:hypothetical protein